MFKNRKVNLEDSLFLTFGAILWVLLGTLGLMFLPSATHSIQDRWRIVLAQTDLIPTSTFQTIQINTEKWGDSALKSKISFVKTDGLEDLKPLNDVFPGHWVVDLKEIGENHFALVEKAWSEQVFPEYKWRGLLLWGVSCIFALAGAFLFRFILIKMVFSRLYYLNQVIFEHKLYDMTGGKLVDERGKGVTHSQRWMDLWIQNALIVLEKAKNIFSLENPKVLEASTPHEKVLFEDRQSRKKFHIERLPSQPQVNLSTFSNNEIGYLASFVQETISNTSFRHKLLRDVIEAIQVPILLISKDLELIFTNRKLMEALGGQNLVLAMSHAKSLENFLHQTLGFPSDSVRRVKQLLEGKGPRFELSNVGVRLGGHTQSAHIQISCLLGEGRKYAFFTFDFLMENSGQKWHMNDAIYDLALTQLREVIQLIRSSHPSHSPLEAHQLLPYQRIIEQINSLFDLTYQAHQGQYLQSIEFNIHSFFVGIKEQFFTKECHLMLDKSFSTYVKGDPGLLRHSLLLMEEMISKSTGCDEIQLTVAQGTKNCLRIQLKCQPTLPHKILISMIGAMQHFLPFFAFHLRFMEVFPNEICVILDFPYQRADGDYVVQLGMQSLDPAFLNLWYLCPSSNLKEESLTIFQELAAHQKKSMSYKNSISLNALEAGKPHACVVYTQHTNWHQESFLEQNIKFCNAHNIPCVLLAANPKRGDARHATLLGFAGYLSGPFSKEDLNGIIQLVIRKFIREPSQNRMLVTKHSLREFFQNVGKILIAQFEDCKDGSRAEHIRNHLAKVGFRCEVVPSQIRFFEELYAKNYDFVFVPLNFPIGIKRRMSLSLKQSKLILYRHSSEDSLHGLLGSAHTSGLRFAYLAACESPVHIMGSLQKSLLQEEETPGSDPETSDDDEESNEMEWNNAS